MKKYVDLMDSDPFLKKINAFFLAVGEIDDYTRFAAGIFGRVEIADLV